MSTASQQHSNTPEALIDNASPARKLLIGVMVMAIGSGTIFGAAVLIALFVGYLGHVQARRDAARGVTPAVKQARPTPGLPGAEPNPRPKQPGAPR